MKTPTHILVLLLLFVLPLLSNAQQDSIVLNNKATEFKNQIDLDVEYLGVSFGYKRKIIRKIFFGVEANIGIPRSIITIEKNIDFTNPRYKFSGQMETRGLGVYLDHSISEKVYSRIGFKYSLFDDTNGGFGSFFGMNLGIFYNLNKIELGIKPFIGIYDENTYLIGLPIFLIRMNIAKW